MTFTKERIENLLKFNSDGSDCHANAEQWEVHELALMALAALTAEPVYQACKEAGVWVDIEPQDVDSLRFNGEQIRKVYTAPTATVVPDEKPMPNTLSMYAMDAVAVIAEVRGWNACRAAMLQGAEPVQEQHESAGSACKCRSSEKVQELQAGWVAVPVDMAPEMMRAVQLNSELGGYAASNLSGAYSLFREFWDVAIAAAQDFREIPDSSTNNFRENAETSTKCWCHTCRPVTMNDMRFVVCPECGNKRCPRANDCRNVCSGSNEPGQEGSAYPASPQQESEQSRIAMLCKAFKNAPLSPSDNQGRKKADVENDNQQFESPSRGDK